MIICHLDRLRAEKARRENRSLALLTVARETGLSYNALQRMRGDRLVRIQLSTLLALCRYFEVRSLAELIEYYPSFQPEASDSGGTGKDNFLTDL